MLVCAAAGAQQEPAAAAAASSSRLLPADTEIHLRLLETVASNTHQHGDRFKLGKLSNGTYFIAQVPVGAHAFTVHSEAKDVLNLEVERGETYYVQGSISMGVMVGRPNLAPSDAATFNALKDKLKDSAAASKKK